MLNQPGYCCEIRSDIANAPRKLNESFNNDIARRFYNAAKNDDSVGNIIVACNVPTTERTTLFVLIKIVRIKWRYLARIFIETINVLRGSKTVMRKISA